MEIERKFIVHNLPDNLDSYPHSEIEQGYLCMEPVIRIRRMNKQYFLTFKSKGLIQKDLRSQISIRELKNMITALQFQIKPDALQVVFWKHYYI